MNNIGIRYPIGVQSFENLRKEGYIYVDKTGYISQLLRNKYYFLSRPRRFGKSLLLSTLEAYFKGRKELFEGLEISKYEKEWVEYPVVHIDFASMRADSSEKLESQLMLQLKEISSGYGIEIPEDRMEPELAFGYLIKKLDETTGRKVVVLIDEYDKGIIEMLRERELVEEAIRTLRPFFSVMKSHDRHIHFAFITGVSRFRNTTIFSGLNNPKDISMKTEYAALCGITRAELENNFKEGIEQLAKKHGHTPEKTVELLLQKYDGYRFTSDLTYVCNPFSILNALDDSEFGNYWIMSGSSKILIEFMRESHTGLDSLTKNWVDQEDLSQTYSSENPLSLLFQTGYLTVGDWDGENFYRLRIPNQEVQSAMAKLFVPEYTSLTGSQTSNDLSRLRRNIYEGNTDDMMKTLQSIVSSIPYHEINNKLLEKHLHLSVYVIFMMLGANTHCEMASSAGRVDMVAETPWRVYVFEFKLDTDPSIALKQIHDKGYAIQWEARDRKVVKIGVNFSSEQRTITEWKVE